MRKVYTFRNKEIFIIRKATKEDGYGRGFLVLSTGKIIHKSLIKK